MKPFDYSLHTETGFLSLQELQSTVSVGKRNLQNRFRTWQQRLQTRKQLSRLGQNQLLDIGLTAEQVNTELSRPFWS